MNPLPPRVLAIIATVAREHGVSVEDVRGRSRAAKIAAGRQDAMSRVRHETGASSPMVGRWFGRDHSTVLHACRKWLTEPGLWDGR